MAYLAESGEFFGGLRSARPFFLMAGPNVIQSVEHVFAVCRELKRATDELDVPFIFKSSFDKANRTSLTRLIKLAGHLGQSGFWRVDGL